MKLKLDSFAVSGAPTKNFLGIESPTPALKINIDGVILRTRRKIHNSTGEMTFNEVFLLEIDDKHYNDGSVIVACEIINRGILGNVHETLGIGHINLCEVMTGNMLIYLYWQIILCVYKVYKVNKVNKV